MSVDVLSVPEGFRYPYQDTETRDVFYFDCRSVPRPRPNLVYIFRGVCSNSGYLPAFGTSEPATPGCPVIECPYNTIKDAAILDSRSDYLLTPVVNLRPNGEYEADPGAIEFDEDEIACIRCPVVDLLAFDEEPADEAQTRFRPLNNCPFCGIDLEPARHPPIGVPRSSDQHHFILSVRFFPPKTAAEAGKIGSEPIIALGPVCDLTLFHRGTKLTGRDLGKMNLAYADLSESDLRRTELTLTCFIGADLSGADLSQATGVQPDLSKTQARGLKLRGAVLDKAWASNISMPEADARLASLKYAYLDDADLRNTDLAGANLREASLRRAILENANLAGADLVGAKLDGANLKGANLAEADFTGASIAECVLRDVTAPGAIFDRADLHSSEATHADFSQCSFHGAILSEIKLDRASLSGADLSDVECRYASIEFADLRHASIASTDLRFTSLRGSDLRGTVMQGSSLEHADLLWVDLDAPIQDTNSTAEARLPSESEIAFGPAEVQPPNIEVQPVYRLAATSDERKAMLATLREALDERERS